MSRNLSAVARAAVYAAETDQVFLQLLVIDHEDLAAPLRFVANTESVVSNGNTYLPFPFTLDLPDEREGVVSSARLTIDNVDRQVVTAIRSIDSAPTVTFTVVLASSPDDAEAGPFTFTLRDVTYNAQTVSGELIYEERLDQEAPKYRFCPGDFRGLF